MARQGVSVRQAGSRRKQAVKADRQAGRTRESGRAGRQVDSAQEARHDEQVCW